MPASGRAPQGHAFMNGWAGTQMGLIFQVYGLAFFVLGVVAFVLPRQDTTLRFARDLWLLAIFGMLHGVLEFVEWERLHNPAPWLADASSLLLAASYLPLLEFGRRSLAQAAIRLHPAWLYGIAGLGVAATALAAASPLTGLAIGSRYFIGLPGALFTGLALFALQRSQLAGASRGFAGWLAVLAAAFLVYGALTPFVSAGDAALPAWLPSMADFLAATGLPIQLLRTLCAVAATLALIALVSLSATRARTDLQRTLGSINGFVYRCNNDADWSLVDVSGNVEKLCGYTADEFLGRKGVTLGGLIHADDAPRVWVAVQDALRERRDFDLSYRLQTRHRGLIWVYEYGRGIFDEAGRLRFLEGHITDATALVQANEALRVKDAALESSLNAIAMAGLDGRISYVNPAFVRLWQLDGPQDAIGRSPLDFWENPQAAEAVVAALQQHGRWQGELRARRADGTLLDLQLSANMVVDDAGKPVCMMSSFIDLSEHIQAEHRLRESTHRLNLAQGMAHLGSWEWDIESGTVDWSDEQFRIQGVEPGAVTPSFDLFSQMLHPQDRERVLALIGHALNDGAPYETDFRIVRPDGSVRFLAARGEVRRAADGRPLQMFGMGQDITARRAAEEATRAARRQLQGIIDAATQVAIIATDAHGLITLFNRGAEQMLGYRAQDMVGRQTPLSLHDAAEMAARAEALSLAYGRPLQGMEVFLEPARRGDSIPREWTYVRSDGIRLTVNLGVTPLHDEDGSITGFLGVAADITASAELLSRLNKIGRNAPGMIYQYQLRADGSSCFPYASEGIRDIYGVAPGAVAADAGIVFEVGHPEDIRRVAASIQASARELTSWHAQYRVNHPAKGEIWVEGRASPERLADGSVLWHGVIFDITEQKQTEIALARSLEELRAAEQRQRELLVLTQREQGRMAALLSGMSIGILFEDRDNRVEYVNPSFRHMWAIKENVDLVGQPTQEVLEHSTHRLARPDHASKHILQVLDTHEISERFEVDLYDGRILTQLSYPVSDPDGRVIGRLWLYEDITHERQTAQQLIYLAEHDALTGLHNRHRFQEHLERMIGASARSGARFGLLYFDLDEFKYINDTFGHRAGDTVLVRAAGEVASLVRGGEMFARVGGDEFAILVEMIHGNEPAQLAERVVHAISAIPFRFRGSNLRLTASIGIALFPQHGDNAEDLVAHADTAMYQAKGGGKNTWAVYDASRNTTEAMLARMTWRSRIAQALEQDGLELHFQGIYQTRDGSLSHLEALVRMRDPQTTERLIMPGQFIPVAEKTGQILEIDRWVIRRSIETLAQHPGLAALAVNVSGRSFDDPALPRYIHEQLEQHGVAPKRL
ncbi:MAG: hypothetical protein CVU23_01350, partial [Betaproteobacteria bacterium HGW-Betaproteobacteria-17]